MQFLLSDILASLPVRKNVNIMILVKFLVALLIMIIIYSVLFHFLMALEGQDHSWITGFYWTLTVMSTLGFGDITFTSDYGKLFSVIVLMSGIIFLLIMLPFTFIQFFYAPWLEKQNRARAPRELPEDQSGHVILTSDDPLTLHLLDRLKQYQHDYALIMTDARRAVELHDMDVKVVLGDLDDPETYRRLRADKAAMVIANVDDMTNTNIAFTVREICPDVPIIANADNDDSVDILELAGSTHVIQFKKLLGRSLARRTLGANTQVNVIGRMESLRIAEAPAMRTPLQGKTLQQSRLRESLGINVVGVWERGRFMLPTAETPINSTTVLVLAGSSEQLKKYDKKYGSYEQSTAPILILGGGQVGQAAADVLRGRKLDYRVIEKNRNLILDPDKYIPGSAADIDTLMRAGIKQAPSVLITTHDDPTNIYLTIYIRRLRPDLQIISRANLDRNVSKLHTAGADLVMSLGSIFANTILNLLKPEEILMLSEGLYVFRLGMHPSLVGQTIRESHIRRQTGCSIIAVSVNKTMNINPPPDLCFEADQELILVGNDEAVGRFFKLFPDIGKISHSNGNATTPDQTE